MEVEDILAQVDILEYISQYCEFEEKNGEWWALSPFKDEKTPSFSVDTEKQMFYDFSSGIGGNLIHFIRRYNNCGFYEAVNVLKKYANISDDTEHKIVRLESTKIAKRYRKRTKAIKESKSVILPSDYMNRYEFNKDKLCVWADEGIDYDTMKKFDVRYDTFSDRIVFPIKNYTGEIINVSGRTLDRNFKEKKLRKYTYFAPLGTLDTLYGFSDNRQAILEKNEIILFEGAKSVMIADTWGIKNSCAILTSHLNPNQLRFLIQLGVRVVFALDEDINIKDDVNIEKLKRYVKIEYIQNHDSLLNAKMSPVDAGFKVWKNLYERRLGLN